jgi:hypothetical protein
MDTLPPSPPALVTIIDDSGGGFYEYMVKMHKYRMNGTKVALINCRSACTMALSLPNVCVYPRSVLKFHAAYYEDTKEIAERETKMLLQMYPEKVRQKLGSLDREFKTLTGKQLIQLGISSCSLVAKADRS